VKEKIVQLCVNLLLAGCADQGPVMCTTAAILGIVVEISNANSGLHVAFGATGAVRDGVYVDSLVMYEGGPSPGSLHSLAAAYERPGVYEVSVSQPGYEDWMRSDVTVRDGACHVRGQRLHAEMSPVH